MNERISFGVKKREVNNKLNDVRIFPFLSAHDNTEGIFDEMHEQGNGYLADRFKSFARERFVNHVYFDRGATDTYDLLPINLQQESFSPTYVDKIMNILAQSIKESGNEIIVNFDWFEERFFDFEISRLQQVKAAKLGPVDGFAYRVGSDAMKLAFGIRMISAAKSAG